MKKTKTYKVERTKSIIELPEQYINCMVTYKKTIFFGVYGDSSRVETVTKRGFYSNSDGFYNGRDIWIKTPNGSFSIPPRWAAFNGVLLPDGWGGDNLNPEQVINWEYCQD